MNDKFFVVVHDQLLANDLHSDVIFNYDRPFLVAIFFFYCDILVNLPHY